MLQCPESRQNQGFALCHKKHNAETRQNQGFAVCALLQRVLQFEMSAEITSASIALISCSSRYCASLSTINPPGCGVPCALMRSIARIELYITQSVCITPPGVLMQRLSPFAFPSAAPGAIRPARVSCLMRPVLRSWHQVRFVVGMR